MHRREFLGGAAALAMGAAAGGAQAPRLNSIRADGNLVIRDETRPVFVYRLQPAAGPAGTDPLFERNAYLHPVHAPNGAVVTDDFPADHPHQRGVFFAWTRTRLALGGETLEPDFWNLGSGLGRVRGTRVEARAQDDLPLHLTSEHVWEARRGRAWEPVLDESWEVVLQPPRFAGAERERADACFVLDLTSRQRPRVPIELPRHRYGGMAVRGARAWLEAGRLRVLTSEGHAREAADESVARWVDMSGEVEGRTAGIALLEHPENLRHPNRLRVHPEVPYFVFAVPQTEPARLDAGREHVFRYRMVAHNGPADAARLDALWSDFAGREPG